MSTELSYAADEISTTPSAPRWKKPKISTARMGPTEHSATRPKLSEPALRSLRICATPTPRARMKGTVMGPVVTPPESNAMPRKSASVKAASRKMRA